MRHCPADFRLPDVPAKPVLGDVKAIDNQRLQGILFSMNDVKEIHSRHGKDLARLEGFEPPTNGFGSCC